MRHRTFRLLCLSLITVLPAVVTWREVRDEDGPAREQGTLVKPGQGLPGEMVASYLAHRDPRVDAMLPAAGGGRYFVAGMDAGGKALLHINTILIEPGAAMEEVEVHELAHLLQYRLPREASAVMSTLGAPDPEAYAAKNDREHFAEMFAKAWLVLIEPREVCLMGDATDRLLAAEKEVPGTAGVVAYMLSRPEFAALPLPATLRPTLDSLITPEQRPAWQALWTALDARRSADGLLQPWPAVTALDVHRDFWQRSESRVLRGALRVLFLPSEMVVRVVVAA
jgi:hypothetical protein